MIQVNQIIEIENKKYGTMAGTFICKKINNILIDGTSAAMFLRLDKDGKECVINSKNLINIPYFALRWGLSTNQIIIK